MAYFSNGSEGSDYEDRYCSNCVNYRDRDSSIPLSDGIESCPIWDIHFFYNYDQCGKTKLAKTIANILGDLIPRREDGFAGECKMFRARGATDADNYAKTLRESEKPVFGEWLG